MFSAPKAKPTTACSKPFLAAPLKCLAAAKSEKKWASTPGPLLPALTTTPSWTATLLSLGRVAADATISPHIRHQHRRHTSSHDRRRTARDLLPLLGTR